ncbi:transglutaminase-like domain-containing protein [Delftia tsuruhatensis]
MKFFDLVFTRICRLVLYIPFFLGSLLLTACAGYPEKSQSLDPELNFSALVEEVNGLIKYGNSPNFLDENALLLRGYGQCADYVELLSSRLTKLGVIHQIVGMLAYDGTGHSVVEVQSENKHFTLDPTLGVAYHGGIVDILRDSRLAHPFFGTISEEQRRYGGVDFFGQIAIVNRIGFDPELFDVDLSYLEESIDNGKISISWPEGLDARFVTFIFSRDSKIRLDAAGPDVPVTAFKSISIVPPKQASSISIALPGNESIKTEDFSFAVSATRSSAMSILPIFTPLATYLAFEGGVALIDEIELRSKKSKIFEMNIGSPASEKGAGKFLFAPEFFPVPVNTWGGIVSVDGNTYRVADARIKASSGHAAIQISPLMSGISDKSKYMAHICYINRKDDNGDIRVKIFNVKKQQYVYIGTLLTAEERRCDDFPIPPDVINSTLGD